MDSETASSSPRISQRIDADLVLLIENPRDKAEVIERLVRALCERRGLQNSDEILEMVLKREEGISTTLDTGLSLPHARIESIQDFHCILGVLSKGFKDSSGLVIRLMLVFFSPANPKFFSAHLKFLRVVSNLFQADLVDKIVAEPSPEKIVGLIKADEAS